uniref:DNA-directed RNA polymerase subunit beta'' n=1 Tax=Chaetophoropsis polyrhiza TaxID=2079440 RepID=A0A6H1U739_9CHLO|nr:RNA polymerase beta'' subunit [Chaetophoropsis polyrhiza]QIZ74197.1 RNA polymerase beta'' subunit [Chaetophoropsis polyrhiza]
MYKNWKYEKKMSFKYLRSLAVKKKNAFHSSRFASLVSARKSRWQNPTEKRNFVSFRTQIVSSKKIGDFCLGNREYFQGRSVNHFATEVEFRKKTFKLQHKVLTFSNGKNLSNPSTSKITSSDDFRGGKSGLGKDLRTNSQVFLNLAFNKGVLKNFVFWCFVNYGQSKTIKILEKLQLIGFSYATKAGISLSIDDLKIPPIKASLLTDAEKNVESGLLGYKKAQLTGLERFQRIIETWHKTSETLKDEMIEYFRKTDTLNPVYMMAFSGARGNVSQVRQLVSMRGLMSDPQGKILSFPIQSNFREGLTLTEYVISCYGARKGVVDTALRTANAGYLTRRLVDVAQHVIVLNFDCGTKKGFYLTEMTTFNKTLYPLRQRLIGRVLAADIYNLKPSLHKKMSKKEGEVVANRNQEISEPLAQKIAKLTNKVFIRSPLTCATPRLVCQLCYGWSLSEGYLVSIGEAVGIIAAQSIGEPGTQLTMRTFHTGGVFSGEMFDQLIAPYDAIITYSAPVPGTLIRTTQGKIAFLLKGEGQLSICKAESHLLPEDISQVSVKSFRLPPYTVLFQRNNEKVLKDQLIAELAFLSSKIARKSETAEFILKSELEGQIYSGSINLVEKYTNYNDVITQSTDWGTLWLLSGKICQLPLNSAFFALPGDLVDETSVLSEVKWFVPVKTLLDTNSVIKPRPRNSSLFHRGSKIQGILLPENFRGRQKESYYDFYLNKNKWSYKRNLENLTSLFNLKVPFRTQVKPICGTQSNHFCTGKTELNLRSSLGHILPEFTNPLLTFQKKFINSTNCIESDRSLLFKLKMKLSSVESFRSKSDRKIALNLVKSPVRFKRFNVQSNFGVSNFSDSVAKSSGFCNGTISEVIKSEEKFYSEIDGQKTEFQNSGSRKLSRVASQKSKIFGSEIMSNSVPQIETICFQAQTKSKIENFFSIKNKINISLPVILLNVEKISYKNFGYFFSFFHRPWLQNSTEKRNKVGKTLLFNFATYVSNKNRLDQNCETIWMTQNLPDGATDFRKPSRNPTQKAKFSVLKIASIASSTDSFFVPKLLEQRTNFWQKNYGPQETAKAEDKDLFSSSTPTLNIKYKNRLSKDLFHWFPKKYLSLKGGIFIYSFNYDFLTHYSNFLAHDSQVQHTCWDQKCSEQKILPSKPWNSLKAKITARIFWVNQYSPKRKIYTVTLLNKTTCKSTDLENGLHKSRFRPRNENPPISFFSFAKKTVEVSEKGLFPQKKKRSFLGPNRLDPNCETIWMTQNPPDFATETPKRNSSPKLNFSHYLFSSRVLFLTRILVTNLGLRKQNEKSFRQSQLANIFESKTSLPRDHYLRKIVPKGYITLKTFCFKSKWVNKPERFTKIVKNNFGTKNLFFSINQKNILMFHHSNTGWKIGDFRGRRLDLCNSHFSKMKNAKHIDTLCLSRDDQIATIWSKKRKCLKSARNDFKSRRFVFTSQKEENLNNNIFIYKIKNLISAISLHEKIVFPGQKLVDDVTFDNCLVYVQCFPESETHLQKNKKCQMGSKLEVRASSQNKRILFPFEVNVPTGKVKFCVKKFISNKLIRFKSITSFIPNGLFQVDQHSHFILLIRKIREYPVYQPNYYKKILYQSQKNTSFKFKSKVCNKIDKSNYQTQLLNKQYPSLRLLEKFSKLDLVLDISYKALNNRRMRNLTNNLINFNFWLGNIDYFRGRKLELLKKFKFGISALPVSNNRRSLVPNSSLFGTQIKPIFLRAIEPKQLKFVENRAALFLFKSGDKNLPRLFESKLYVGYKKLFRAKSISERSSEEQFFTPTKTKTRSFDSHSQIKRAFELYYSTIFDRNSFLKSSHIEFVTKSSLQLLTCQVSARQKISFKCKKKKLFKYNSFHESILKSTMKGKVKPFTLLEISRLIFDKLKIKQTKKVSKAIQLRVFNELKIKNIYSTVLATSVSTLVAKKNLRFFGSELFHISAVEGTISKIKGMIPESKLESRLHKSVAKSVYPNFEQFKSRQLMSEKQSFSDSAKKIVDFWLENRNNFQGLSQQPRKSERFRFVNPKELQGRSTKKEIFYISEPKIFSNSCEDPFLTLLPCQDSLFKNWKKKIGFSDINRTSQNENTPDFATDFASELGKRTSADLFLLNPTKRSRFYLWNKRGSMTISTLSNLSFQRFAKRNMSSSPLNNFTNLLTNKVRQGSNILVILENGPNSFLPIMQTERLQETNLTGGLRNFTNLSNDAGCKIRRILQPTSRTKIVPIKIGTILQPIFGNRAEKVFAVSEFPFVNNYIWISSSNGIGPTEKRDKVPFGTKILRIQIAKQFQKMNYTAKKIVDFCLGNREYFRGRRDDLYPERDFVPFFQKPICVNEKNKYYKNHFLNYFSFFKFLDKKMSLIDQINEERFKGSATHSLFPTFLSQSTSVETSKLVPRSTKTGNILDFTFNDLGNRSLTKSVGKKEQSFFSDTNRLDLCKPFCNRAEKIKNAKIQLIDSTKMMPIYVRKTRSFSNFFSEATSEIWNISETKRKSKSYSEVNKARLVRISRGTYKKSFSKNLFNDVFDEYLPRKKSTTVYYLENLKLFPNQLSQVSWEPNFYFNYDQKTHFPYFFKPSLRNSYFVRKERSTNTKDLTWIESKRVGETIFEIDEKIKISPNFKSYSLFSQFLSIFHNNNSSGFNNQTNFKRKNLTLKNLPEFVFPSNHDFSLLAVFFQQPCFYAFFSSQVAFGHNELMLENPYLKLSKKGLKTKMAFNSGFCLESELGIALPKSSGISNSSRQFSERPFINHPSSELVLTSYLSPFKGEILRHESYYWSQNTQRNRYLFLTKTDQISFYSKKYFVDTELKMGDFGRPQNDFQDRRDDFGPRSFASRTQIVPSTIGTILQPICVSETKQKKLVGQFINKGDYLKLNSKNVIISSESGILIHYNKFKITLRKAQSFFLSPNCIFHYAHGDLVEKNKSILSLPYQQLKTGDIVQGIPKVEQLLEARSTFKGKEEEDNLHTLLIYVFELYKKKFSLKLSVRKAVSFIQLILVNSVQRIYRSQGVNISDKHLEVVVKQMTSKVQITSRGDSSFFRGEYVDLYIVETWNSLHPQLKKICYKPILLGISRSSLEVNSFLSAASFQHTKKVLSRSAFKTNIDFLNGLKENVIIGNLISAGTGSLTNNLIKQ